MNINPRHRIAARRFVLTLAFALSLRAAEPVAPPPQPPPPAADPASPRIALEEAQAEAYARRIVNDHESGARKATEEELAVARTLIRDNDIRGLISAATGRRLEEERRLQEAIDYARFLRAQRDRAASTSSAPAASVPAPRTADGATTPAASAAESQRIQLEQVMAVAHAQRVVYEAESGVNPATAEDLEAARTVIREAEVRRAAESRRLDAVVAEVQRRRAEREKAAGGSASGGVDLGAIAPPPSATPEERRLWLAQGVAEAHARIAVYENELGDKKATPAELAAAGTIIHEADARRVVNEQKRLDAVVADIQRRRAQREQAAKTVAAPVADSLGASAGKVRAGAAKPGDPINVMLPDADMRTVATTWRMLFGREPVVADRAKSRLVSIKLSGPAGDELRQQMIAALKDNGIAVIERPEGVLLDTEPERRPEPAPGK